MTSLSEQAKLQLERLLKLGLERYPFLPWHTSEDPFVWLVAELLLRRTTRTAATRVFAALIHAYPTPKILAQASQDEVRRYVSQLGLGNVRSKHLVELAQQLVRKHGGMVPHNRQELLQLPGVGEYVADAVLLHAFQERALPLDAASQRVVRRLLGLAPPARTRHSTPEKDEALQWFKETALSMYNPAELKGIHLGLLVLSWETCKRSPKCNGCLLQPVCSWREGASEGTFL